MRNYVSKIKIGKLRALIHQVIPTIIHEIPLTIFSLIVIIRTVRFVYISTWTIRNRVCDKWSIIKVALKRFIYGS